MKPIAPVLNLFLPLAGGLASLPLLVESPLWGLLGLAGSAGWAYSLWRGEVERRPPLPTLTGEEFAPFDVSISWRTPAGEFPTSRRGWRAVLGEDDLWLAPIVPNHARGGDRDHIRVPRLDIVHCDLGSDSEVRVRFLDEDGRTQAARLSRVPRAERLAQALGYTEERKSRIV